MAPEIKPEAKARACLACHAEFPADVKVCPADGTTLTELKRDNLVGTVFADKYEVLDIIGGGGMGLVYRAKQRFINRIVAMKVLHKANLTSADALRRFQLEAQASSALNAPNIVTIFDFGVSTDGQPYMVMDYLEGASLDELLTKEGRLGPERAAKIFIQVCNALSHAHSKGIIHRDIKPSNIVLISVDGEPDFVKLVDFGIAKVLTPLDPDSGNLTKTGEVFGSPHYMSPEQVRGNKLDPRTDIYSLGAVMYRALAGRSMFTGNEILQVLYKHIEETPPAFAAIGLDVAPELERIVFKALHKNPNGRYQSMQELSAALKEFLEAQPKSTLKIPAAPIAFIPPVIVDGAKSVGERTGDGAAREPFEYDASLSYDFTVRPTKTSETFSGNSSTENTGPMLVSPHSATHDVNPAPAAARVNANGDSLSHSGATASSHGTQTNLNDAQAEPRRSGDNSGTEYGTAVDGKLDHKVSDSGRFENRVNTGPQIIPGDHTVQIVLPKKLLSSVGIGLAAVAVLGLTFALTSSKPNAVSTGQTYVDPTAFDMNDKSNSNGSSAAAIGGKNGAGSVSAGNKGGTASAVPAVASPVAVPATTSPGAVPVGTMPGSSQAMPAAAAAVSGNAADGASKTVRSSSKHKAVPRRKSSHRTAVHRTYVRYVAVPQEKPHGIGRFFKAIGRKLRSL